MNYEKLKRDILVMERVKLVHDMLTEIRKQINEIEMEYFGLVGEEFGELTVLHRRDKTKVVDQSTIYIPAWNCHCTCGENVIVSHEDLVNENIRHCGGEIHTTEFVEI